MSADTVDITQLHLVGVNEVASAASLASSRPWMAVIVHRPPSRTAGITRFRAVPVAAMIGMRTSFMNVSSIYGRFRPNQVFSVSRLLDTFSSLPPPFV